MLVITITVVVVVAAAAMSVVITTTAAETTATTMMSKTTMVLVVLMVTITVAETTTPPLPPTTTPKTTTTMMTTTTIVRMKQPPGQVCLSLPEMEPLGAEELAESKHLKIDSSTASLYVEVFAKKHSVCLHKGPMVAAPTSDRTNQGKAVAPADWNSQCKSTKLRPNQNFDSKDITCVTTQIDPQTATKRTTKVLLSEELLQGWIP